MPNLAPHLRGQLEPLTVIQIQPIEAQTLLLGPRRQPLDLSQGGEIQPRLSPQHGMAGDSHVPPGDVLPGVVVGSIGDVDFHEISTFHFFVFILFILFFLFYKGSQEQPRIGVVIGGEGVVTPGKNSIAEEGEKVNGVLKRGPRWDPLSLNILFLWELVVKEELIKVH